MKSAIGGGGGSPKRDNRTDRLREWDSDKGEGVQKSQNLRDFIYGWFLMLDAARTSCVPPQKSNFAVFLELRIHFLFHNESRNASYVMTMSTRILMSMGHPSFLISISHVFSLRF